MAFNPLALITETILGGIMGGITNVLQKNDASDQAKSQAKILKENILKLQEKAKEGKIHYKDMIKQIDTMVAGLSTDLKNIVNENLSIAEGKLNRYYDLAVQEMQKVNKQNTDALRSNLVQRRLGASGAGAESFNKLSQEQQDNIKKLNTNTRNQISDLNRQAINNLAQQMVGVNQNAFNAKQGLQQKSFDLQNDMLGNILQLGNKVGQLNNVQRGTAGDFLNGFLSNPVTSQGAGALIKGFLDK